jgi:hypothetical protein
MALLNCNIWRDILGIDKATVIESVEVDEEAICVVANVKEDQPNTDAGYVQLNLSFMIKEKENEDKKYLVLEPLSVI